MAEAGYWQCAFCIFMNESNAQNCWACRQKKTTISGWVCADCSFTNESDAEFCFVCGGNDNENYKRPFLNNNKKNIRQCNEPSITTVGNTLENDENFKCPSCFLEFHRANGIVLKNCQHKFCRQCLTEVVQYGPEDEIKCPFKMKGCVCQSILTDQEVNALLTYELDKNNQFDGVIQGKIRGDGDAVGANEETDVGVSLSDEIEKERKWLDYLKLIELEEQEFISNVEEFECPICFVECDQGEGIVIRNCLHTFCKECVKQAIQYNTEPEMKCPFGNGNEHCESFLQDREIRALVDPEVYERHLNRSVTSAQSRIKNAFHCITVDCEGWCIHDEEAIQFHCPICEKTNCINCKAIHEGLNCKQYQEKIEREKELNSANTKSVNVLEEMLKKGEAMRCPQCRIILTKITGCDWIQCSMCKTEICWATRGPRWGPKGRGDTSGGCRCLVNRQRCHPNCGTCH